MQAAVEPPVSAPRLKWQRAVTQDDRGQPQLRGDHHVEVPELLPGTVLVKTTAVALNPVDYKMGAAYPRPGAVMGTDFAGSVVRVADRIPDGDKDTEAETPSFAMGDQVFGAVLGFDPRSPNNGASASVITAGPAAGAGADTHCHTPPSRLPWCRPHSMLPCPVVPRPPRPRGQPRHPSGRACVTTARPRLWRQHRLRPHPIEVLNPSGERASRLYSGGCKG